MTDLTEQWKKGELPVGYYYVKNEFNNIFPSDYSESYDSINDAVIKDFFTEVSEIKEVLDKVPSYDELQNMNNAVNECMAANIKLVEENEKLKEELSRESYKVSEAYCFVEELKELLKKARDILEDEGDYMIVQKIDEELDK